MEATLKFNLEDPVDAREHSHAPFGYRYALVLDGLIGELAKDASNHPELGPITDVVSLAQNYAEKIIELANRHGLPELAKKVKSLVPMG